MYNLNIHCETNGIDLRSFINCLKSTKTVVFRVGTTFFVKDEKEIEVSMKIYYETLVERRKEQAKKSAAMAADRKVLKLLNQKLLEAGLTPKQINTFVSENQNDEEFLNLLRDFIVKSNTKSEGDKTISGVEKSQKPSSGIGSFFGMEEP